MGRREGMARLRKQFDELDEADEAGVNSETDSGGRLMIRQV